MSPINRFLVLLIGASALAACQIAPVTEPPPTATLTSTSVPPPVNTPTEAPLPATPTLAASPTPTATPEPTATPTPNLPPTPDPNQGVGDVAFEENFTGASGWNWSYTEANVVNFTRGNGQLDATMFSSNAFWRISVGPEQRLGDQQTRVTVRANLCAANDEMGLLVRGTLTPNNRFNGYLFKINCSGRARIEKLTNSEPAVLLDWTASPNIATGAPAENTLLVWAAKGELRFYVNDRFIGGVNDASYPEGILGLYLRDRTQGGLSVSYTNLVARSVNP